MPGELACYTSTAQPRVFPSRLGWVWQALILAALRWGERLSVSTTALQRQAAPSGFLARPTIRGQALTRAGVSQSP